MNKPRVRVSMPESERRKLLFLLTETLNSMRFDQITFMGYLLDTKSKIAEIKYNQFYLSNKTKGGE